jgi:hypothetical protein
MILKLEARDTPRQVIYEQQPNDLSRKIADGAEQIKRLSPKEFPELPAAVRQRLVSASCRIPQRSLAKEAMNVIHGEFAKRGQTDWAVLCSRGLKSRLLIFWGGPVQCKAPFKFSPDTASMFGIDDNVIYDRRIASASTDTMRRSIYESAEYFHQKPPFSLDHDGIWDGTDKGLNLYYCNSKGWHNWGFFE